MAELNERHKRFCEEYIACKFNGTQAAINAGYSEKAARVEASRLLTNANIQTYLSELIKKDTEAIGITKDRVLLEIGRLATSDIRKCFKEDGSLKDIHELDEDTAATLAGFEVEEIKAGEGIVIGQLKKIKRWDKTKSLEMLAKIHKLYSDAPVQNNTNQPFSDNQVDKIINALKSNATKGT